MYRKITFLNGKTHYKWPFSIATKRRSDEATKHRRQKVRPGSCCNPIYSHVPVDPIDVYYIYINMYIYIYIHTCMCLCVFRTSTGSAKRKDVARFVATPEMTASTSQAVAR